MHGVFTNILWYLEFLAFAIILILFFLLILYSARNNYVPYNPRFDMRKNVERAVPISPLIPVQGLNQRPPCYDPDCIWFCRLFGSITVIAVCYYFAYTLIADTKLKFGMFVP